MTVAMHSHSKALGTKCEYGYYCFVTGIKQQTLSQIASEAIWEDLKFKIFPKHGGGEPDQTVSRNRAMMHVITMKATWQVKLESTNQALDWEWSLPFCFRPQVRNFKGLKTMVMLWSERVLPLKTSVSIVIISPENSNSLPQSIQAVNAHSHFFTLSVCTEIST